MRNAEIATIFQTLPISRQSPFGQLAYFNSKRQLGIFRFAFQLASLRTKQIKPLALRKIVRTVYGVAGCKCSMRTGERALDLRQTRILRSVRRKSLKGGRRLRPTPRFLITRDRSSAASSLLQCPIEARRLSSLARSQCCGLYAALKTASVRTRHSERATNKNYWHI